MSDELSHLVSRIETLCGCHEVAGVCARHPREPWTRLGCPSSFRAAYRLRSDYHGTDAEEARLQELVTERGADR